MEHAQRTEGYDIAFEGGQSVLILILMEHAQRGAKTGAVAVKGIRLNPYFNGTCSKRKRIQLRDKTAQKVLILILMEHAQRDA